MLANRPSEDPAELKYLGITLAKQNCSHVDKSRLCIGNICRHSIQNLCVLLTKQWLKYIFFVLFCMDVTLPHTWAEEYKVCLNKECWREYLTNRDKILGRWDKNCIMLGWITCTYCHIIESTAGHVARIFGSEIERRKNHLIA
jgi:hypothetical protein